MSIQEMVDRVRGWITDRARSTEESLEVAENIRDLCEEWVYALRDDLRQEAEASEAAPHLSQLLRGVRRRVMRNKVRAAMQRVEREHLLDARVYCDTLFADRQILAAEIARLRSLLAPKLRPDLWHVLSLLAVGDDVAAVAANFDAEACTIAKALNALSCEAEAVEVGQRKRAAEAAGDARESETCPSCSGRGQYHPLQSGEGCGVCDWMSCERCHGSGKIAAKAAGG